MFRQKGETLISLLIGTLMSMIIIAGVLLVFRNTLQITVPATQSATQDGEKISALIRAGMLVQEAGFGVDDPDVGNDLLLAQNLAWSATNGGAILQVSGNGNSSGEDCNGGGNGEGNNGNGNGNNGCNNGNGNGNGNSNENGVGTGTGTEAVNVGSSLFWGSRVSVATGTGMGGTYKCQGVIPGVDGGSVWVSANCNSVSSWGDVPANAWQSSYLIQSGEIAVSITTGVNCEPYGLNTPGNIRVDLSTTLTTGSSNYQVCLVNFSD